MIYCLIYDIEIWKKNYFRKTKRKKKQCFPITAQRVGRPDGFSVLDQSIVIYIFWSKKISVETNKR